MGQILRDGRSKGETQPCAFLALVLYKVSEILLLFVVSLLVEKCVNNAKFCTSSPIFYCKLLYACILYGVCHCES